MNKLKYTILILAAFLFQNNNILAAKKSLSSFKEFLESKGEGKTDYIFVKESKQPGKAIIRVIVPSAPMSELIVQPFEVEGNIINIKKNSLGIKNGDTCAIVKDNNKRVLVCKSGKVIRDVCKVVGSSTGTPGYIEYANKYVGYRLLSAGSKSKPGSGKREIYYLCK